VIVNVRVLQTALPIQAPIKGEEEEGKFGTLVLGAAGSTLVLPAVEVLLFLSSALGVDDAVSTDKQASNVCFEF
jgi:hypothetical protein